MYILNEIDKTKHLLNALDMSQDQLENCLCTTISDFEAQPKFTKLLTDHEIEIQTMYHVCKELSTISTLIPLCDKKINQLRNANPSRFLAVSDDSDDLIVIKAAENIDKVRPYSELRSRAYGKTIVLVGDDDLKIFHIAQANVGFPEIGVLNRLSPVAQRLVYAEVGDNVELPFGEYKVIAVAILNRHENEELLINLNNFKSISFFRKGFPNQITFLDIYTSYFRWKESFIERIKLLTKKPHYKSDERSIAKEMGLEVDLKYEPISLNDVSSLCAQFYTKTTKEQEELMQQADCGVIIAEGVAGSGKTSVALGRTKVLSDRKYSEGLKNTDFELNAAVGYVLNGQLIDYLQETKNRLALYEMQIREFHELRSRLVKLRKIDQTSYKRVQITSNGTEGLMPWLFAADRSIAKYFFEKTKKGLGRSPKWPAVRQESRIEIADVLWEEISNFLMEQLSRVLSITKHPFLMEEKYKHIDNIRHLSIELTKQDSVWLKDPIKNKWVRFKNALVAIEYIEQINNISLSYKDMTGEMVKFERLETYVDEAYANREYFKIYKMGENLSSAEKKDIRKYFLENRLLSLQKGKWKLYISQYHKLIKELESSRIRLYCRFNLNEDWQIIPIVSKLRNSVDFQKIMVILQNTIRERLINFFNLIDAYANIILDGTFESTFLNIFKENGLSDKIHKDITLAKTRLKNKTISDHDIDILICISHLMSLGYKGKDSISIIRQWSEPPFHSMVFIDEVQDFTETQVFLMAEQANPNKKAVTVVGDTMQQLTKGRMVDIKRCFPRMADNGISRFFLSENKRQNGRLAEFTKRFRHEILNCPQSSSIISEYNNERDIDNIEFFIGSDTQMLEKIKTTVLEMPNTNSVAIICPTKSIAVELENKLRVDLNEHYRDTQVSERRDLCRPYFIHFTSPLDVKGLEFDNVIVPYFDCFDLDNRIEANQAYVSITRPRIYLHILGRKKILKSRLGKLAEEFIKNKKEKK